MNSSLLFGTLAAGLVNGTYYGLLGLAIAVIYRTTDVANFAQGEIGLVGTFLTVIYIPGIWLNSVSYIILSAAIAGVFSAAVFLAIVGIKTDKNSLHITVRTLGIYMLLHAVTLLLWGHNEPYRVPPLFGSKSLRFGDFLISVAQLDTMLIAVAVCAILYFVIQRTKIGLQIRAMANNNEVATLIGVNVNAIAVVIWCIAGAIGGIVTAVVAPLSFLGTQLAEPYLISAFTAAVLGGLKSFPGVIVGGLILGVLESVGVMVFSVQFQTPFVFAVLLFVLLVKPEGLFGRMVKLRV